MGTEVTSAVEVSEPLLPSAASAEEEEIPPWRDQITVRGIVVSVLLGSLFCIITHKLNLTVGVIPSLNVAAGLLGFFLVRSWTGFLNGLGFSVKPFTRQENTVIQTCVVACYGLAFSGGFGSYMLSMGQRTYELIGVDYPGNRAEDVKNPELGWMIGFMFVVSFLGLFSLVALRKVMVIDYKLTYPSGTATALLINSFHTSTGAELAGFWNDIMFALSAMGPLVRVLRMVETEVEPPMGFIYQAMEAAKIKIAANFKEDKEKYIPIWDIIDNKWEGQLHHPLHAAGYYLNPRYYYTDVEIEMKNIVMEGLNECISRLIPDFDVQDKVYAELEFYKSPVPGTSFASLAAIRQRDKLKPAEWWSMFGSKAPNLQKLALKILNLTCSASGCERNWSVFEQEVGTSRTWDFKIESIDVVRYEWRS